MGASSEDPEDCYDDGDDAIDRFLLEANVDIDEEPDPDDQEEEQPAKKLRLEPPDCIESGAFSEIPNELFRNILKFLSAEDLSNCAKVCRYLRRVTDDSLLWRRLYCLRWGLPKSRNSTIEWKQLYFEVCFISIPHEQHHPFVQRDKADVVASLRNSPLEFREYYMQMQVAKRSEAPLSSRLHDDLWVVDPSIADQVTAYRRSRKLADNYSGAHTCSGETCSYHRIGDVYICEKTGCAHVCGDACREIVRDPNDLHVCTVSGRCFDPVEFSEREEDEAAEPQQVAMEEGEAFIGSGRLARAYCLGYSGYRFEKALRCC